MRASFNVLDQAWIPVISLEGKEETLGIRETILRAQELREITSASPLEEYSLYRFLGLFLMDMLRPESETDIEDFLEDGRFDEEDLESYIALCRAEGVSFDLFDEERPFLQSRYDPKLDGEPRPVSVLDATKASGNNHVHFDHNQGEVLSLSPARAARLLLSTYLFCTAAAQGYPSGVNASPPYFGVIQGKNLFGTLVFTLLPLDRIGISFDDPPVLWRRSDPVIPKKEIGKTSWLQGMLFPTRRIHLMPDEAGNVSAVHLCQGENFVNKVSWRDPYVSYRVGKDGLFPMRPSADRAIWRNLSDIVNIPGGQAAQLLSQYRSIQMSDTAEIVLYGVETSQASYLGVYRHSLRFPLKLTGNENTVSLLQLCIRSSELLAAALRKSLSQVEVIPEALTSLAVQDFYQSCERRFWELCEQAGKTDPGKEDYIAFCDEIGSYAGKSFSIALAKLNLRAAALAAAAKQKEHLDISIRKLKKEARL